MKNKGFSLVELIIVIAIMAILVGVMAPQLIKYIEKTNISADKQLCDSVASAITYSMTDCLTNPALDDDSKTQINQIQSGTACQLVGYDDTTMFALDVSETLGTPCSSIGFRPLFKSKIAKANGDMYVQTVGGQVIVWIDGSDATADGQVHNCTDAADIDEHIICSM